MRHVFNALRALTPFRGSGLLNNPEAIMPIDLILGAITAAFVLIYLLAVLARPERY